MLAGARRRRRTCRIAYRICRARGGGRPHLRNDCGGRPWRMSRASDGQARQQMFAAMLAPDYPGQRELVENCRVPVALVVGGDDGFVDAAYLSSPKCANLWSGAVIVFDGLGHARHLHAPDRFVPVLEAFLAGVA